MKPRSGTEARCSASSTPIWLATNGLMPSSYDFCSTGPITNAVRNIASAIITEFGGAVAVPSAVRSSDSTTTMRVNEVIMTRIDGAIDSTVNSAISWIERSVTPPLPWPRLILISCAIAGSTSDPAAISVTRNITLRGKDADLTKETSDGPARMPSRLPDFRSRFLAAGPARGAAAGPPRCAAGAGPAGLGSGRRRAEVGGARRRPAQRGFKPLRHLGEVLIGARQRRRGDRRAARWRGGRWRGRRGARRDGIGGGGASIDRDGAASSARRCRPRRRGGIIGSMRAALRRRRHRIARAARARCFG